MPLTERGFAVIVEEMYHAQLAGVRGVDVTSVLTTRTAELRKSSFGYTPQVIWSYLQWALRTARSRLIRRDRRWSPRLIGPPLSYSVRGGRCGTSALPRWLPSMSSSTWRPPALVSPRPPFPRSPR